MSKSKDLSERPDTFPFVLFQKGAQSCCRSSAHKIKSATETSSQPICWWHHPESSWLILGWARTALRALPDPYSEPRYILVTCLAALISLKSLCMAFRRCWRKLCTYASSSWEPCEFSWRKSSFWSSSIASHRAISSESLADMLGCATLSTGGSGRQHPWYSEGIRRGDQRCMVMRGRPAGTWFAQQ